MSSVSIHIQTWQMDVQMDWWTAKSNMPPQLNFFEVGDIIKKGSISAETNRSFQPFRFPGISGVFIKQQTVWMPRLTYICLIQAWHKAPLMCTVYNILTGSCLIKRLCFSLRTKSSHPAFWCQGSFCRWSYWAHCQGCHSTCNFPVYLNSLLNLPKAMAVTRHPFDAAWWLQSSPSPGSH